ncbi:hypothetical protein [Luethyella okanaganae]|uniref:Uncharacterized protein n=1 Tax=Luethyella okanaganae TaxID=69372 RepID=A0ABW1VIG6_9MICO
MSNYSGVWPIVAIIATVIGPSVLIAALWGVAWAVLRSRFVSWQFTIGAGSLSLLLALAGLVVLFFWPVTPDPQAALFSDAAGIKIFGGIALIVGGLGGLVTTLATWGICELARRTRATT